MLCDGGEGFNGDSEDGRDTFRGPCGGAGAAEDAAGVGVGRLGGVCTSEAENCRGFFIGEPEGTL